jgi:hypothetical protein
MCAMHGFYKEILSGVDMRIRRVVGLGCAVSLALFMSTQGHAGGWCGFQHPGCAITSTAASFYVGYFSDPSGLTLSFQSSTPSNNSLNLLSQTVDFQGVWFELLAPIKISGPLGMVSGASYHFPFQRNSHETINTGGVGVNTTWKALPQWGGIQLALTYQINHALTALVGFKYESLLVNFSQPVPANPTMNTGDLSINEYIPYFGFAYKAVHPSMGLELETALIGFPALLGSVDFRETVSSGFTIGGVAAPGFRVSQPFSNGRFLEWFAEVSLPVKDYCRFGSFVRYNVAQATAKVNPSVYNSGIPSVDYDFNFDNRVWGVGGLVSLSF